METMIEHLSSTGQGTTLPKYASKTTERTAKETESPERKGKCDRHPASPEDPDPSEPSGSDSDAGFYRRRNQDKPQKARKSEDDQDGPVSGTYLKLAMQFLSRPENKWSRPRDKRYSTDEYVRHYSHMMTLFEATSSRRVHLLTMALTDDALDEYYSHVKYKEEYDHINNESELIRIVSKRLETPKFYMMIKNKWWETKLCDVRHQKRLKEIAEAKGKTQNRNFGPTSYRWTRYRAMKRPKQMRMTPPITPMRMMTMP